MIKFTEPDVRPISDHFYKLYEDYTVESLGEIITVPKDYITDLASIPKWVWTLSGLTPDGLYRGAAVVHDYIYGKHDKTLGFSVVPIRSTQGQRYLFTRKNCDDIFRDLMVQAGETGWKVWAMYHAVRTFGWIYY